MLSAIKLTLKVIMRRTRLSTGNTLRTLSLRSKLLMLLNMIIIRISIRIRTRIVTMIRSSQNTNLNRLTRLKILRHLTMSNLKVTSRTTSIVSMISKIMISLRAILQRRRKPRIPKLLTRRTIISIGSLTSCTALSRITSNGRMQNLTRLRIGTHHRTLLITSQRSLTNLLSTLTRKLLSRRTNVIQRLSRSLKGNINKGNGIRRNIMLLTMLGRLNSHLNRIQSTPLLNGLSNHIVIRIMTNLRKRTHRLMNQMIKTLSSTTHTGTRSITQLLKRLKAVNRLVSEESIISYRNITPLDCKQNITPMSNEGLLRSIHYTEEGM